MAGPMRHIFRWARVEAGVWCSRCRFEVRIRFMSSGAGQGSASRSGSGLGPRPGQGSGEFRPKVRSQLLSGRDFESKTEG